MSADARLNDAKTEKINNANGQIQNKQYFCEIRTSMSTAHNNEGHSRNSTTIKLAWKLISSIIADTHRYNFFQWTLAQFISVAFGRITGDDVVD